MTPYSWIHRKAVAVAELECFPYGVGHADEGVCLLARLGPYRVLLDCGIATLTPLLDHSQGMPPADLVLCSHAHPDHVRGVLEFHRAFPQIPIYASEVTAQLLLLNWQGELVDDPYFCQALPWRSPVEFREGLSAELFPAGHLPGAAAFLLTYTTSQRAYTLFYTGDFFLSNSRLVEGLPLEELRGMKPDVLILEGSYGTSRLPHRRQQENHLADKIIQAIAHQHSVLLPTPTLGLGQELLMLLRSHHHFTGQNIDIWVDGTVVDGCDAYLELLSHFPSTVQNFARHQSLFWDDRIRPRVRRLPTPSAQELLSHQPPRVVLTDTTADLSHYCHPDTGNWLLLLPEKPGQMGAIESTIYAEVQSSAELQNQINTHQITLDTYLLGDHCDGPSTTQLIHNLRPQHVVFIHGSPAYLTDLASLDELQNRYHLHCPDAGTGVEFPVGETFLQPPAPEARYEGELTDLQQSILIALPDAIASDPRWQSFADTGLVEARWQGEELVIRGMSQREILNRGNEAAIPPSLECCENCLHYRGQRCWNQASPLFGFKVTPEGYCPAFEAEAMTTAKPPRSPMAEAFFDEED